VVPTFPGQAPEPTPRDLDQERQRLTDQLDAIGANIGAVPEDIRDQLLARCEALVDYADAGDVEAICQSIATAIDTNDPGLIDRVLTQLAALEGD
jgi:phosphoglycerate-specific signal transduction histidine kinase